MKSRSKTGKKGGAQSAYRPKQLLILLNSGFLTESLFRYSKLFGSSCNREELFAVLASGRKRQFVTLHGCIGG